MGTTADFAKLRAKSNPKVGQWNFDFKKAVELAKQENKILVTLWTNGDACGYCVSAEKCMMQAAFKDWMAKQDVYFVFKHSGDASQGKDVKDWVFGAGKIKYYPGFRVTLSGPTDTKNTIDFWADGNTLRDKKTGAAGAKAMIAALEKVFAKKPVKPEPAPAPAPETKFKIRLNEKLTVAQCNKIFDSIDKNEGYCPCQPKGEGTQCHCEDFKSKGLNVPCICNLFVKVPVANVKRACALARECVAKARKTYVGESVGIRCTKKRAAKK